jgi:outer membrane lipoprotein SlyB
MRAVRIAALLSAALALVACAPRHPAATISAAPDIAAHASHGTIVSLRPLPAAGSVEASILGMIGGGPAANAAALSSVEFIVREDDGGTISVVQANAQNLLAGERVVIARGARTSVVRG